MVNWDIFWGAYLWGGLSICVYVLLAWMVSLHKRDTSIVDIFWGPGFVLAAVIFFLLTDGWFTRRAILLILVGLWGVRLATYIGIRNHGKPEDPRYRAWREQHGSRWPLRSLITVFMFQGLLMWLISIPLLAGQISVDSPSLIWLDYLGIGLWLVGFLFETIADYQLFRFKRQPQSKNKVYGQGLWRYTRHPNYFGEFLLWWGFGFIGLTSGLLWVMISPVVMSILLMKFSGVGLLEKNLKVSKPGYHDYISTTSAFFPWPKKAAD